MIKIVYFYESFIHRGGTERILIEKMNWLSDYGFEVIALTSEQGSHSFSFDLSANVKHIDLNVRFFTLYQYSVFFRFFKMWRMKRLLQRKFNAFVEEHSPDIVICTTYIATYLSVLVDCPLSFKKVAESHIDKRFLINNDYLNRKSLLHLWKSKWELKMTEKLVRHFDLLVTLNLTDANDWAPFVKTKIITNTVHQNDTGKISNGSSKHAIFVGRYTEQKGLDDLLAIWGLVHKFHSDWHLDLYGDGEKRDELFAQAERMHANIHIHMSTANIFEKYVDSSIFLIASHYEPFGLVLPEAMSCGLPVVAFEADGPCKIITDGVDGFLIENRNIKKFADCVCQLIENKSLRLKMGQAGILSAQQYSRNQIMPQWKELFESLVNL